MNKKKLLNLVIMTYCILLFIILINTGITLFIIKNYMDYIDKKIIDIYYNKIIISNSLDFLNNICDILIEKNLTNLIRNY